ncbi:hypothetical protein N7G274_010118 [Stereocaulon virgatum]
MRVSLIIVNPKRALKTYSRRNSMDVLTFTFAELSAITTHAKNLEAAVCCSYLRTSSTSTTSQEPTTCAMLFFSFFKTLVDHEVTVELKNDISIKGTLKSVDQFLNIKLDDIQVVEELKYPHLSSVKNVFIRGSVVRYVHLPGAAVDTALLEDATRREAASQASKPR